MKRISALLGGAVFGVALLAACGGGGGGSGTSAPGGPLPPAATNAPAGATQSFSASDAAAIPTAAPGATSIPVPLPSDPGGASASAALPTGAQIPPDATVAATYSTSGDASLPALSVRRLPTSLHLREDSKNGAIAYLKLQFSADVTLPQAPAFSFVVPGTLPTDGVSYWLAFFDPLRAAAGWQKGFEGPAVVTAAQTPNGKAATKLAFASNGQPIAFSAGQSYYFAVIAVATTAATPTPVPSTVPTNPPHDGKPQPVLATPANIQFPSVTSSPVAVTFGQQGFTGAFQLHGDCTGIVNTGGASPTWTITPVGQGRCVLIGLGDRGATAVVHVGVVTPFETPHPSPTPRPSESPEPHPSVSPEPTHAPTTAPTHQPSSEPTHAPSTEPTHQPTTAPTHAPTTEPTRSPSPTPTPTHTPGSEPTHAPTATPTPTPTPGTSPAQ
ncbi:MAG TPA: hypothetical protein VGC96_08540 [Candidatus Elarobacter sp.]